MLSFFFLMFVFRAPGDAWSRLATLMNLLEKLEQTSMIGLVPEHQEGNWSILESIKF